MKEKKKKMYYEKKKTHPWGACLDFIFRKVETHLSGNKEYFIKIT